MGYFGPKNGTSSILDWSWEFFENFVSCFSRKKSIWGNLIFLAIRPFFTALLGMVKSSHATVNWILKQPGHDFFHDYYWIIKQLIRILKQQRHDFSGKHLYGGYCMNIM